MPYLDPATVLERFSGTLLSEIRPTIPDDEELVRAQAGSMASTLRFLAAEIEREERALASQHEALLAALSDTDAAVEAVDTDGADRVAEAVASARASVEDAEDEERAAREGALLSAADDVLAAIDAALDGDDARRCRTPVYRFLDRRLEAHHAILGREGSDDE